MNGIKKIRILSLVLLVSFALMYLWKLNVGEEPPQGAILGCTPATGVLLNSSDFIDTDVNALSLRLDDELNSEVLFLAQKIDKAQDIYFKNNGQYFQGLSTHDIPPIRDVKKIRKQANKLSNKPVGQSKNWLEFGVISDDVMFFSVDIDQYLAPNNLCGYQTNFSLIEDGKLYVKSLGRGPEAKYRSHDWELYEN